VIEENVEGVTRFIALFQIRLPNDVGPVRSARTGDLDLLAAMRSCHERRDECGGRPAVWISARNVVQIFSEHVPSPVDARSPNPITVGVGNGVVHRNGRAFQVVWSRPTPFDGFVFTDAVTGAEIPLGRGTTFLQLQRDR
jgi:hypothetical protein